MPIEDNLNEVLAKTFPLYDKETKSFNRKKRDSKLVKLKKRNTGKVTNGLKVPLFSIRTEGNKYSLYFSNGIKTSNVLKMSKTPYELLMFDELLKMAVVRKKTESSSSLLYLVNLKTGSVYSALKLGAKVIRYIPKTHELFLAGDNSRLYTVLSHNADVKKIINVPIGAELLKAESIRKYTSIIDKDGKEMTLPLIEIGDESFMQKYNHLIDSLLGNSERKIIAVRKQPQPEEQISQISEIKEPIIERVKEKEDKSIAYDNMLVTLKHVKTTLEGVYNDVWINGRKVLSNHINTTLKTFGGGVILGVHGIVTDDKRFPLKPIWMVYDTSLKLRVPDRKQAYSDYNIQVMNVLDCGNKIRLDLSNKSNLFLDMDRVIKNAVGKRFLIAKEK